MNKKTITKNIEIAYDEKILIINRGMQDKFVVSREEADAIADYIVSIPAKYKGKEKGSL